MVRILLPFRLSQAVRRVIVAVVFQYEFESVAEIRLRVHHRVGEAIRRGDALHRRIGEIEGRWRFHGKFGEDRGRKITRKSIIFSNISVCLQSSAIKKVSLLLQSILILGLIST